MVKFTAGLALIAASALSLSNAAEYKVRVRNLTYQQPFSPPLIVAHTTDVSMFQEGSVATDAIKLMAEDGDNSALLALGASDEVFPFICGGVLSDVPVFPGETWRGFMMVDETICPDAVFSAVSMLINTNDAFMGIDSDTLRTTKVYPPAFDAGTEMNNELCSHMPGPACAADSGNMMDAPGEGFIHVHRGFHGLNEGIAGELSETGYDWRNPVAEVFISKQ
ncbi:unnamed protein product [Pylaiella littoralis]